MRYSKGVAFSILLPALPSIPGSAPAQVSINTTERILFGGWLFRCNVAPHG